MPQRGIGVLLKKVSWGMGRYISYSVTIPSGTAKYEVFFSVDRLTEEHEIEAGTYVTVNAQHVAIVNCRAGTLVQKLEGIDLPLDE